MTLHDLEVYVCLNEEGDYVAASDAQDALNQCMELGGQAFRTVKLMVTMAAPDIPAIAIRVPGQEGQVPTAIAIG